MANGHRRGAVAIAVQMALGASVSAVAVAAEEKVTELGKIAVDADASSYKADIASSPKYTQTFVARA